jgi:hypothetical protein
LENAPGGVHVVLKETVPNGVDLIAIGFRYSTKTRLFLLLQPMQDLQGLEKSMR